MQVIDQTYTPDVTMFSDASGNWGCGAIWNRHWLQWEWEGLWSDQQITIKELVPIVAACAIWGSAWQDKQVFMCDNMAVVQVIAGLSSKDPTIMHLLRCMHYYQARYNIHARARHVPGALNAVADSISRHHMQVFRELAPQQTHCPLQYQRR